MDKLQAEILVDFKLRDIDNIIKNLIEFSKQCNDHFEYEKMASFLWINFEKEGFIIYDEIRDRGKNLNLLYSLINRIMHYDFSAQSLLMSKLLFRNIKEIVDRKRYAILARQFIVQRHIRDLKLKISSNLIFYIIEEHVREKRITFDWKKLLEH